MEPSSVSDPAMHPAKINRSTRLWFTRRSNPSRISAVTRGTPSVPKD
jgi:hypothetical protein